MKYLDKETYKSLCKLSKEFLKKGYWATFSAENIFYMVDEKRAVVCSFVDSFGNDVFGIPFYFGDDGLNSLHDLLTVENDYSISIADHNCTNIMICRKESLLPEEIDYIRSNDMKILKENNIVVRTFKKGFASRIANDREAIIVLQSLAYLKSVIENESGDLVDAFRADKQACVFFNNNQMQYQVVYNNLPPLEKTYRKNVWNRDIVNEFKTFKYTDDACYLTMRNIMVPVSIKDSNQKILPLLVCYSNQTGVVKMNTIIAQPNHYSVYLVGFLEEVFSVHGIPSSLEINDRRLFYGFSRLFEELNVSFSFKRENPILDELLFNLDRSAMSFFATNINDNQSSEITAEEFQRVFSLSEADAETIESEEDYSEDESLLDEAEELLDTEEKKHFVS